MGHLGSSLESSNLDHYFGSNGGHRYTDEGSLRRVGPYRLEKRLSAGGMGEVYKAFDTRLKRFVALKKILPTVISDPTARERFRREARSAARLNHPGIIRIHDVLEAEHSDWIVMELLEGETLGHLIRRGKLPFKRLLSLSIQISKALAAAHADGIVHRDLKAGNVLVTPSGRAKILDFGLAKSLAHASGETQSLTADGAVLGTPQAMSPEQAMGCKVDLRSDLFSLGSLLYEMATGVAPFRAGNAAETLSRVCTYHPPVLHSILPAIRQEWSRLVDALLAKSPSDRPRNAAEVVSTLTRITDFHADTAFPVPPQQISATDQTYSSFEGPLSSRSSGERRQISVLCCDLVDAGEVSSRSIESEDLVRCVTELEKIAKDVPESFGGYFASKLGDRLVVYFGYPIAHENDARRAVQTGIELISRVEEADLRSSRGNQVVLRGAVHTGPAIVMRGRGSNTLGEQLALGQTLETAHNLGQSAEPSEILVSADTHGLIKLDYVTEPSSSTRISIKKHAEYNESYRILAPRPPSSQWQSASDLPPLLARQSEVDFLLDRWSRTRAGRGQIVLVSGEAGIGKTRLIYGLRKAVGDHGQWLDLEASSDARYTPFHPISTLLQKIFRLTSEDNEPRTDLDRLEAGLGRFGLAADQLLPILAPLLSLPLGRRFPSMQLSPQKQREKTFKALCDLFFAMAEQRPTVLAVEDLQWLDPSTLELLGLLAEQGADYPIFLLFTARPELEIPWPQRPNLVQLNLSRLSQSDISQLIGQVTGGRPLPSEILGQIVELTDGIPLFAEEVTRALIDSGRLVEKEDRFELKGSPEDLAIPTTLRGSLIARLDRLGDAKDIVKFAATIGREFSFALLAAASKIPAETLEARLRSLVDAGIVLPKGFSSRRRYLFRHALLQEAATHMLLKGEQRGYHRQLATALQQKFPRIVASRPEVLARHLVGAGAKNEAVGYWHQAGSQNIDRSANQEAIRHLRTALDLLSTLPAGADRDARELELLITLGPALIAIKTYSSDEVEQVYRQAKNLCDRLGETPKLFAALFGLFSYYLVRSELDEALDLALQILRLAEEIGDAAILLPAHVALGNTYFFRGELNLARRHLDEGIAINRQVPPQQRMSSQDFGVTAHAFSAQTLWLQSRPEQALRHSQEAVDRARALSHPFSLAFALFFHAMVNQLCGRFEEAQRWAKETITLAEDQGFVWWIPPSNVILGAAISQDPDRAEEALDLMEASYDTYVGFGGFAHHTLHLALRIEAALRHKRLDAAENALRRAFEALDRTDEAFFSAEIHRLQGEYLLLRDDPKDLEDAQACFTRASELAHAQGAKHLEQRALDSLSRMSRVCCGGPLRPQASQDRR